MRLCTTPTTIVRRTWTVELRPQQGGSTLLCPQCIIDAASLAGRSARSAALAHLACHARRDALPPYLRICQCHEGGCRWHSRHRGCAGPVLLVLTRERQGRIWRLADTCAACAGATDHAAVVPDTHLIDTQNSAVSATPETPARGETIARTCRRVRDMLGYLTTALPAGTSAEARLLALQCALRTNKWGVVHLPGGLLRGMHLAQDPSPWQDLEQAHWLQLFAFPGAVRTSGTVSVQLLDPAVLAQPPNRRHRLQSADWILRVAYARDMRPLGTADRLTALALASSSLLEVREASRTAKLNRPLTGEA